MRQSIAMLLRGQAEVVDYYRRASERWQQIWSRPESDDWEKLADIIQDEEAWFERNCGGRWLGQEIMVVSGIGGLYSLEGGSDTKREQARRLYDAFQISYCSLALKSIADDMARLYRLHEKSYV